MGRRHLQLWTHKVQLGSSELLLLHCLRTGSVTCRVRILEQQSVLRVHGTRFRWAHAKELSVKSLRAEDETGVMNSRTRCRRGPSDALQRATVGSSASRDCH